MDRVILTMIPEYKERELASLPIFSDELNYRYKYEVWYDLELKKWTVRTIPRKRGRNNRICEVE